MKNFCLAIVCLVLLTGSTGVGRGILAGKIDQKEYEIRKDQIARDSFFQK
jgi:hypothetical protein